MEYRQQSPSFGTSLLRLLTHGSNLTEGKRRALYSGIAIATMSTIWLPLFVFLILHSPTYTSRWDMILPGAGAGLAVSLESIGQASATAASPYNSHSVDPRVNYKAIAVSEPVLSSAAMKLNMTLRDIGKPRIKLVEQTALMHFSITASTAEQAQRVAQALHQSLNNELERLRADELKQRESAINLLLQRFDEKLRHTQQSIIDYQAHSSIISLEQFNELMMNLERVRANLRQLKAEHASIQGSIEKLIQSLGTSLKLASAFHTLQQDALFQELAIKWATSVSQLTEVNSMWAERHPEVIKARNNHDALRSMLHRRAMLLLPDSGINTEKLISLSTSKPTLYTDLIALTNKENGIKKQIANLEDSLVKQQTFLDQSTTDASNLEDLKRKHQVATAVMTTALAKLDIGKSNHFSSYPLLQILAEPTLPDKADTLSRNLALLGAVVATLMTLFGLLLLWIRKSFLQKILKNI